jgi:hypothetical protein
VLNSCIDVSDYNEPYSLCQPPSSLPDNPWFNDDKPRGIHTPLHLPFLSDNIITFKVEMIPI